MRDAGADRLVVAMSDRSPRQLFLARSLFAIGTSIPGSERSLSDVVSLSS